MGVNFAMKVQLISDLHLGHDFNHLYKFDIPKNSKEVILVIAGDLTHGNEDLDASVKVIAYILKEYSKNYKNVIYVFGNHEYYFVKKNINVVFGIKLKTALNKLGNVFFLDRDILTLEGHKFLGTTLWFSYHQDNNKYSYLLNDYNYIEYFSQWVYKENEKNITWLKNNLRENDIVITHHMPSPACVDRKYFGSNLNRFFVCNMEDVILEKKPKVWFFGHTHESYEGYIGKTHLFCNPYGYDHEQNPNFLKESVIDI